ncbi:uncharacterized protein LOC111704814, partial [Eurytemora carolleeae]|uniref:uncharacterized protein LOC111704814 n=1 Tax=Eurytemora carolleeae TaxID=1294199 RepID=UPI000C76AC7E
PNPDEVTTPNSQIIPWKLIESRRDPSVEDHTGEDLSRADPAKDNDLPAKDHNETDPEDPDQPLEEDPTYADDPTAEDPANAEDPVVEDPENAEDPSDQTAVEKNLENDLRSAEIGAAAIVITEADEENIDPEKNHNLNFATVHRKLRNAPRVQTSQNAAQKKMKNVKDIHREQTSSKSTYKPNPEKQYPERKNGKDLYQAGEGEEELRAASLTQTEDNPVHFIHSTPREQVYTFKGIIDVISSDPHDLH